MNNDQLAALLESFKVEIIARIEKQGVQIESRFAALEAKLPASAPTPPAPEQTESIWRNLETSDALASYEVRPEGWINTGWSSQEFPGDRQMLMGCWMGVEVPTGRVMHGGDQAQMSIARERSLYFHDLDVAEVYGDSEPAKSNISPEVAACLMCLRYVDVVQGGLGSNASRSWAAWANTTSLEELYRKLKAASEGTGGPSGGQ